MASVKPVKVRRWHATVGPREGASPNRNARSPARDSTGQGNLQTPLIPLPAGVIFLEAAMLQTQAIRHAPARALLPGILVRETLAPGAFVALILASNYALASMPNVKLFDLLVFVAGYTLGLRRGITVAVAAWLVYGQVNPWGVAQPQLLATLMASEALFAGAGAAARRFVSADRITLRPTLTTLAFLLPALIVTPAYDMLTNVYTGYAWAGIAGSSDYTRWVTVALFNPGALFFMAAHVVSNALFFPAFGPLLVKGTESVKERLGWR